MLRDCKIGVFDSGIGGLSILREIFKKMPGAQVYYISDDDYHPYGNKSDKELIDRSTFLAQELERQGVDLIVVACNTATASAIETLRDSFALPFVGVEPYINIRNQDSLLKDGARMATIATRATTESIKFKALRERLDPESSIDVWSLDNLANIVERIFFEGESAELKELVVKELTPMISNNYTHLILGCTHYPLISELIESILGLKCISPCPYVADRVCDLLDIEQVDLPAIDLAKFLFMTTKDMSWIEREINL